VAASPPGGCGPRLLCATLYGVTTNPTTSFRLPPELLERVDAYAAELATTTGLRVSRAGAVVKLLTDALDATDSRTSRPKRPSSRAKGGRS
jgi:hypothetical protein